jgi:uncharacterized protein YuzE
MKITYVPETDTLDVEFREGDIAEARHLGDIRVALDDRGNVCALTIEAARRRPDLRHVAYEDVA